MSLHILGISIIAIVLAGTAGLIADGAIIYGIFRFKRLRTIPNIFLANWAIADILSITISPTNLVITIMDTTEWHEYTCLLLHGTMILHLAAILFEMLLLIDWCTIIYYRRVSEKLRKQYLFLIGGLWLITILFYCLSVGLCISDIHYFLTIILFIIMYVINILLVIALQCSRIVQKFKTNSISYPNLLKTRLTVLTVITCIYLPAIINTSLLYFDEYNNYYDEITSYISILICIISILSSSVITLGILCWLDKDFRLCLFSRHENLHEKFENEESEIKDNRDSSPTVYNNPIQYILSN